MSIRKSISELIAAVVFESTNKATLHQKALQEKEKQMALASPKAAQQPPAQAQPVSQQAPAKSPPEAATEPAPSKTMDDETDKLKSGDVDAADIVEKLNAIRSGKSFKDSAIKSSMEQYIESLSAAERVALLAFLKGISSIATGEVPAQSAEDPSKHPADIKMQKGPEVHKKSIQPNVIKASSPKQKQSPGAENTSAPVPITPKKR